MFLGCIVFRFDAAFFLFATVTVCLVWRSLIKRAMEQLGVAERHHPVFDDLTSLEADIDLFEIDRFLPQAAPHAFVKDVVEAATLTVQPDVHSRRFMSATAPSD